MSKKFSHNDWLDSHPTYTVNWCDFDLKILEGVFPPDPEFTNSTPFLFRNIPECCDKRVLDLGCGTGILGIEALRKGAREVVFVDVNDRALLNTQHNCGNLQFSKESFKIVYSDLFENVDGGFDYIFANLPIDEDLWSLGKTPHKILELFLAQAHDYLRRGGAIYFTWFSIKPVSPVIDLIKKEGYEFEIIEEEKFGFIWYLIILKSI